MYRKYLILLLCFVVIVTPAYSISIGGRNGGYFDGVIDEVRIYNTSIGDGQAGASYNNTENALYHNFTNLGKGTYRYTAYVQDAAGNMNQTETRTLVVDTEAPQYSQNMTSATLAGNPVLFSLYWTDFALGGYIFSFDNCTGVFVNDTWTEMTGTGNWSNVSKTINSTVNCKIRWRVYANDTVGNMNVSDIYSFRTTSGYCSSNSTSCINQTYSFAGWVFDLDGNIAGDGTVNVEVRETKDSNSSTFSDGYFSILPNFCLSPGSIYTFDVTVISSGITSTTSYKRPAKTQSLNNVSCSSSQPSCSFRNYTLSGWALDSRTGEIINNGDVKVSVKETGDSYYSTFTGGKFSVSPQFCLTPGKEYNFIVSIEGNSKQGFITYKKTGKT